VAAWRGKIMITRTRTRGDDFDKAPRVDGAERRRD
jgi:hypothetical protein